MSETPEQHADEPTFGEGPPRSNVLLSNKRYDQIKFVAQYVLPALAVFYISIAPLWGLPKQEEVAGSIVALDLLLGAVLGLSNAQYQNSDDRFDGELQIEQMEKGEAVTAVLLDSSAVAGKDEVVVKVNRI